jgi:hypothetical protein
MGEERKLFKVLVGNPEGKTSLIKHRRKCRMGSERNVGNLAGG